MSVRIVTTYSFDEYKTIPDGRQRMQKKKKKEKKRQLSFFSKEVMQTWYVRNEVTHNSTTAFPRASFQKWNIKNKTHMPRSMFVGRRINHTHSQPINLPTHNGWEEERIWEEINPNSNGSTCNGKNADQKNKKTRIEKRKWKTSHRVNANTPGLLPGRWWKWFE